MAEPMLILISAPERSHCAASSCSESACLLFISHVASHIQNLFESYMYFLVDSHCRSFYPTTS
jgi:hypothetical protein